MLRQVSKLVRLKISTMVGLASFAGACLFSPHLTHRHFYGVFTAVFLSFGCSALNQFQERNLDARMERTKKRPLPDSQMMPDEAMKLAVVFLLLSFSFALLIGSVQVLFICAATLAGYNFVYTPLKTKTPFALLAGSVIGAVPPLLGYVSAGGDFFSVKIMAVTAVLYLWQIPHFAILAEKYADDYREAGFRTMTGTYGQKKSSVLVNLWIGAYICSLLFVPAAGLYHSEITAGAHFFMSVVFAGILFATYGVSIARFHYINASALLFFLILVSDAFI